MISVRKRTASSEVYYQGNAIVENLVPRFMEKHVMWWKDSWSSLVVDVFVICRPALWPIAVLSPATAYCLSPWQFLWKRPGSWSPQNCSMWHQDCSFVTQFYVWVRCLFLTHGPVWFRYPPGCDPQTWPRPHHQQPHAPLLPQITVASRGTMFLNSSVILELLLSR
jgi:hypothetical protein